MRERRYALRAAAVSAFVYMLAFIGLQFFLPQLLNGDTLHTPTNASVDQSVIALLAFVHRHATYFGTGYVLVAVSYLLVLGPQMGTYLVIVPYRPRSARTATGIGILSVLGITVTQMLTARQLLNWSSEYEHTTSATARLTVIHGFEQAYGAYQVANLVFLTTLAVWLALLGIAFVRLQGTRSLVGWATVVAGILLLSQLPSLPVWALGAAIGLWRLSDNEGAVLRARASPPTMEPASRAVGATGGKANRRPSSKRRRR